MIGSLSKSETEGDFGKIPKKYSTIENIYNLSNLIAKIK